MRILFAVIVFSAVARCQAKLPNWMGAGGIYTSQSSTHYSGWFAASTPISTSMCSLYGLDQAIPTKQNGKLQITTATTAGGDCILGKPFVTKRGTGTAHVVGTAGPATGSVLGLATVVGGGLMWRFRSGFTLEGFGLQNKLPAGTTTSVLLGGGLTW